jgi:DNA mismatch repair protein MutL
MSDIIKLLPDHIANQIAAGEVVQRPASAVKEMLENSIDAGSSNIRLLVKESGKVLIQVIDNGNGMSETDARMSFERHATSKINTIDDLYSIHTLGFRGEALASIAAVAQVELKTKRKSDSTGTLLILENGSVKRHEPCSCPDGTSISVKNLFYNVPARKNFLKSNTVEIRHIWDEFIRVALANPEVAMNFYSENEELLHLRPGNLKQRIVSIFGKKYEEGLVPIQEKTDMLRITGFIGKPEFSRKSRGEQFFFANSRFIKNAYLNHAVATAYDSLLPEDSFPFYCIFLDLSPSRMDVNVHPTKTEIKFDDEKGIYAIIRSATRHALSQYHISPTLSFDTEASIPIGVENGRSHTSNIKSGNFTTKSDRGDWKELYEILKPDTSISPPLENETLYKTSELIEPEDSGAKPVIQLHNKYIVSSIRSGMVIIHQQLAHERVLFEKYINQLEHSKGYSQKLLFPEVLEMQPQDYAVTGEILDDIKEFGFEIEAFGKNAWLISGLPVEIIHADPKKVIENLIEDYKNNLTIEKIDKRENLARALAKITAIKAGMALKNEEMVSLIDELFACKMPYFSPSGSPTIITLSSYELDKKFNK